MPAKKSSATAQIDAIISGGKKKGSKSKSGGGARKIGRYSKHPSAQRYKNEMRWEKNKIKRVKTHLKYHPYDSQARIWLEAH